MLLCPRHPYVLVSVRDTSKIIPAGCMSYACDHCRGAKIEQRTRLAVWSAAQSDWIRAIRLSLVPESWDQCRMQLRDFTRRVRRTYAFEACWAREENPRKTGYHVHMITWGESMPKHRLEELWGGRYVHIQAIKCTGAEYITKIRHASGYMTKNQQEHIKLNGGRSIHMTRGYLRGKTAREALREMSSGEEWSLVRVSLGVGGCTSPPKSITAIHLDRLINGDIMLDERRKLETRLDEFGELPY